MGEQALQVGFVVLFVLLTGATSANGIAKEQLSNALAGPAGWIMLAVLGPVYEVISKLKT